MHVFALNIVRTDVWKFTKHGKACSMTGAAVAGWHRKLQVHCATAATTAASGHKACNHAADEM
jgi:hypothetical protein